MCRETIFEETKKHVEAIETNFKNDEEVSRKQKAELSKQLEDSTARNVALELENEKNSKRFACLDATLKHLLKLNQEQSLTNAKVNTEIDALKTENRSIKTEMDALKTENRAFKIEMDALKTENRISVPLRTKGL